MFENHPGVVDYVTNPNGRRVKIYRFEDWILEEGYKELARSVEQSINENGSQIIICEIATDSLYRKAVHFVGDVFQAHDRESLILYPKAPREVCLERNRRRPDYVSSREEIFFQHNEEDIINLARECGIPVRILSNINEQEADSIVKSLSQDLWHITI